MPPQHPIIACKRCKTKKLKCDDEPKTCRNCYKLHLPCVHVDSRSGREYRRGYIEELLAKIHTLRQKRQAKEMHSESERLQVDSLSASSASPAAQLTYHGEGSVTSMARLVEAAVWVETPDATLMDIAPDANKEQEEIISLRPKPAAAPNLEIAEQLFASYLNGLHLLHPFLHRETLLQQLAGAYTSPPTQTDAIIFRINMVFAIGAVSLFRGGLHHVHPMDYYAAAMQHVEGCKGFSDLEHIQGLLLILLFSLQHDICIGSKWNLARMAMRVCVENRLHKKGEQPTNPTLEQMRRRVFWVCYVNERHSSSALGRPMSLQEEDIDAELPIDADDDLITTGNADSQIFRGMSEVSALLRQVELRRITSKITTRLYRKTLRDPFHDPVAAVDTLLADLDRWRANFPVVPNAHNAYESIHWRDLNYNRESLKCFRVLVLRNRECSDGSGLPYLDRCIAAIGQVATHYQGLRTSDKLILNWTCLYDLMSAGFTLLYCGLVRRDLARSGNVTPESWHQQWATMQATTSAIIDTMSYISGKWPTITTHVRVFQSLASRVASSMQSLLQEPSTTTAMSSGVADSGPLENDFGRHAEMWDAALAAFLDEPLDLEHIDWGAVNWDAAQLTDDRTVL